MEVHGFPLSRWDGGLKRYPGIPKMDSRSARFAWFYTCFSGSPNAGLKPSGSIRADLCAAWDDILDLQPRPLFGKQWAPSGPFPIFHRSGIKGSTSQAITPHFFLAPPGGCHFGQARPAGRSTSYCSRNAGRPFSPGLRYLH